MTFRVGMKVVCVDDDFAACWGLSGGSRNKPVARPVYTVRGVGQFHFRDETASAIWLEEIINPIWNWTNSGRGEVGFWVGRFRPVVENKTDISIFTHMLNPSKIGADA